MTNMKEKRQRVLIVTAFKKNFASIDWSTKTSIKTIKIFNYLEAATKKQKFTKISNSQISNSQSNSRFWCTKIGVSKVKYIF